METNDLSLLYLQKAMSRASWSFIGLLFPLIGIIVGQSGMGYASKVMSDDPAIKREAKASYKRARLGRNISIILFVLGILFVWVIIGAINRFPDELQKQMDKNQTQTQR